MWVPQVDRQSLMSISHDLIYFKIVSMKNYLLESDSQLINLKPEEVNVEDHRASGYINSFWWFMGGLTPPLSFLWQKSSNKNKLTNIYREKIELIWEQNTFKVIIWQSFILHLNFETSCICSDCQHTYGKILRDV